MWIILKITTKNFFLDIQLRWYTTVNWQDCDDESDNKNKAKDQLFQHW